MSPCNFLLEPHYPSVPTYSPRFPSPNRCRYFHPRFRASDANPCCKYGYVGSGHAGGEKRHCPHQGCDGPGREKSSSRHRDRSWEMFGGGKCSLTQGCREGRLMRCPVNEIHEGSLYVLGVAQLILWNVREIGSRNGWTLQIFIIVV
jgi:hypothetical protein